MPWAVWDGRIAGVAPPVAPPCDSGYSVRRAAVWLTPATQSVAPLCDWLRLLSPWRRCVTPAIQSVAPCDSGYSVRRAVWLRLLSPWRRCVTDSGYSVRGAAVWLRLFSPSRRVTPATQSVAPCNSGYSVRRALWLRLLSPSRRVTPATQSVAPCDSGYSVRRAAVWVRRLLSLSPSRRMSPAATEQRSQSARTSTGWT